MHTVAAKESVERMLALHDVVCDRTMEKSHDQSEHESREVRYHGLESSNRQPGLNRAKCLAPDVYESPEFS